MFAPPMCTRCQSNPAMEFDTICDTCIQAEYAMTPLNFDELVFVKRPVRTAKVYATCKDCGKPVEHARYADVCYDCDEDLPF